MSRCTKYNGSFIQKPLKLEEAIEASKDYRSFLHASSIGIWSSGNVRL
jgi:hypothetical protein